MFYKVLIVDDSIENINILKGILDKRYKVMAATNGHTAIKICKKQLPNLVLLDIEMPGIDGYEVCLRLKSNPLTENIPIVFVTSKDKEIDEAKGFAVGAADYVTKPVSPMIVTARVKTHIALSNQRMYLQEQVREKTREIHLTRCEIIKRLGKAVELNDLNTGNHIERVSRYGYIIGKEYGLDDDQADMLLTAAPMHDIGKIGICDNIINKHGKLTDTEYTEMKKHCAIGCEILGDSTEGIIEIARSIALEHHERYDGTGYPQGLVGEEISVYARIVAVADVFDALTTERSYKKAWDFNDAIEYIKKQSEKQFDPLIVTCFLNVIEEIKDIKETYADYICVYP